MAISIDKKKRPLPNIKMGRKPKYPFADMKIEDSFFAENGTYGSLFSCAQNYSKGTTKKFTCIVEGAGIRVWRVK